jgi:hypothetical protein
MAGNRWRGNLTCGSLGFSACRRGAPPQVTEVNSPAVTIQAFSAGRIGLESNPLTLNFVLEI